MRSFLAAGLGWLRSYGERRSLSDRLTHPLLLGPLFGLLITGPVGTMPREGLDPSWRLGLSLAARDGMAFGSDLLFTHGPLAFIISPLGSWPVGALLAHAYRFLVAAALFAAVVAFGRRWMPPLGVVVLALMLAVLWRGGVPEQAAIASAGGVLLLFDRYERASPPPGWVFVVAGALAGFQLLGKVSTGVVAVALAFVLAAGWSGWPRALTFTVSGLVASVIGLWLAMSQSLADLPAWLWGSVEVGAGYSTAMALIGFPPGKALLFLVLFAIPAAVLFVGALVAVRQWGMRVPAALVLWGTAWFVAKQGLVRFGRGHVLLAYAAIVALLVFLPWRRRSWFVPMAAVLVALVGSIGVRPGTVGETIRDPGGLVTNPVDVVTAFAQTTREAVDPDEHDRRLRSARQRIVERYEVPSSVAESLAGHRVHAEPVAVSAVWALGLEWAPVPVFQSYAAYTDALDERNTEGLLGEKGPEALLYEPARGLDRKHPAWESPRYELAIACNYTVEVRGGRWSAVHRTSDVCGEPRFLSEEQAASGQRVRVPSPSEEGNLVFATFELPSDPLERFVGTLLRPMRRPRAEVDGRTVRFLRGTANGPHLLVVPERVGDHVFAQGPLGYERLRLLDVPGPAVVRFYEVPTEAPSG